MIKLNKKRATIVVGSALVVFLQAESSFYQETIKATELIPHIGLIPMEGKVIQLKTLF